MAKVKTRGFFITRRVKEIVEDAKGNTKEVFSSRSFPCRVNAAVPFDHKMLR